MKTIGIDIGGSKIAMGVVENGKILHHTVLANTFFNKPEDMTKALISQITLFLKNYNDVVNIGVGSPGWVVDGVVYEAVNLGIPKYPLMDKLFSNCGGLPVAVENDARTALLAELHLGSLKNCINGAMITFGTGIGGGLVIGRKIYSGSYGYAGELGHLTLAGMGDDLCPCGKKGCFELYASVTALVRMATNGGLNVENGRDFFALANEKNTIALNILKQFTQNASKGIIELAMLLDTDTIAIGGGISNQQELFIEPLRQGVKVFAPKCNILQAELGNDAGIIGAALLWQKSEV